jgi:PAS domain S-box-containing protein
MKEMSDKPIKVLLIEDNPGDARLIQAFLSEAKGKSFQIEVAERLLDGLEALSARSLDVVLLDLSLPDSSGLETLAKAQSNAQQVAIVVLSGLNDEDLAVEAVRKGAQDYLVKGQIDENLLPRAILYAIERKRMEEALRESEEKYRSVVELANDGIAIIQENLLKYVNPRLTQMAGYSVDELIDTPFADYIYPDELSQVLEYFKRRMSGEKVPSTYAAGLRQKNGSKIDVEFNAGIITYQKKPAAG